MHGFDLSPEDHRLLRGEPPVAALRWCERAVGRGARVVRMAALAGGTSSAVHAVDVRDRAGHVHRLVLRRFVRADWLAEEPDAPRREAAALVLVQGTPLPTPELVALDDDGAQAGAPAILMTRLQGAIVWRPHGLEAFLRGLAETLDTIHATPLPRDDGIPGYDPYALHTRRPPSWTRRPAMWRRAFAAFDDPPPATERRLLHRDYHPGNVLWAGGAISGVVDWASTSVGSPDADVGHCRANLAGALGLAAAERFLALTGRAGDYHPYWDIAAALGGADDEDLAGRTARDEAFLAHAVAQI